MKKNIKMILSYDGSRFFGWEHQPNTDMTIQGKLENVLTAMLEGENGGQEVKGLTVIGAGRTDAGVHARAMTANVILDTDKSCDEILEYMNHYLPDDISINKVTEASPHFHSRYNAKGKTYRYTCWYGASKPVFDRKYVSVLDKKPDVDRMRKAAEYIVGMHDFKSFCGNPKMKKSTVRIVDQIKIEESGKIYSDAVKELAFRREVPVIDIRQAFEEQGKKGNLLREDGFTVSDAGRRVIRDCFERFVFDYLTF